jgi:hypothetical protein
MDRVWIHCLDLATGVGSSRYTNARLAVPTRLIRPRLGPGCKSPVAMTCTCATPPVRSDDFTAASAGQLGPNSTPGQRELCRRKDHVGDFIGVRHHGQVA